MNIHKSIFNLFLLLIALVVLSGCRVQSSTAPEADLPSFLSSAPSNVREAYQFAMANPHDLETVPCYCGCKALGHLSNLDCYIKDVDKAGNFTFDTHASGCGVCADITNDVKRMKREGRTAKEIRAYVDTQYSGSGPSTDTPLPE